MAMLARAVVRLQGVLQPPLRLSRLFETQARLDLDQPPFVNAVVAGRFAGSPGRLLSLLQDIETELGRVRQADRPKGPRTIDLDLLFFGDVVVQEPTLVVPHPGIESRRFVLEPLADLAPEFVHPVRGLSVRALLALCPDQGWVREIDASDRTMERTVA
jgi:2-amino-4-hydroxy-6-hydroxymethyldihydropteridine diphosphokinase